MSEGQIRHLLAVCHSLLSGDRQALSGLRSLRRLLLWQEHLAMAGFVKSIERIPREYHLELARALSVGQVESKLWLIEVLNSLLDWTRTYKIVVAGGWFGTLPFMLEQLHPARIMRVYSLDKDPRCQAVAERLNRAAKLTNRFVALTADALDYDYPESPHIYINTSCEHFTKEDLRRWISRIPPGRIVVLQSNNLQSEPGHVNTYEDAHQFRNSVHVRTLLYCGTFALKNYSRFMVIGITGPY